MQTQTSNGITVRNSVPNNRDSFQTADLGNSQYFEQTQLEGKLYKTEKDLQKNQYYRFILHLDQTVSLFKKPKDVKPYKVVDISTGAIIKDATKMIMTNECAPGFFFQAYKNNGKKKLTKKPWIIVPNSEDEYNKLYRGFLKACKNNVQGDLQECEEEDDGLEIEESCETITLDEKQMSSTKVDQITNNDDDDFLDSESGNGFNVVNYNQKDLEAIIKEQSDLINLVEESKDQDPVKQRMLALIKQQQSIMLNNDYKARSSRTSDYSLNMGFQKNKSITNEIQFDQENDKQQQNQDNIEADSNMDDSFVSCEDQQTPQEKIIELAKYFQLNKRTDDYRDENMGNYGGFPLNDKATIDKFRTAFKELLKKIGYELIRGRFQLHRVSFPIKYMDHKTIVEIVAQVGKVAPVYAQAAAQASNPVERMKFCMVASLAYIYPTHIFDKPLNPILGETYEGQLDDGSSVFVEQVCHHPPISYTMIEGPDQCYRWFGYSSFQPKAHLNSIGLNVEGWKQFQFKDGTTIKYNNLQDTFQNTLSGTLTHLIHGKVEFIDTKNGLKGVYDIGNVKKKPKDYFTGAIQNEAGDELASLYGNYMGYIEFDNKRYWDVRDQQLYEVKGLPFEKSLDSDCRKRKDSQALLSGDVEDAQAQKNQMEELQRADRKLRETAVKRRKKGGPLIDYSPYQNKAIQK